MTKYEAKAVAIARKAARIAKRTERTIRPVARDTNPAR